MPVWIASCLVAWCAAASDAASAPADAVCWLLDDYEFASRETAREMPAWILWPEEEAICNSQIREEDFAQATRESREWIQTVLAKRWIPGEDLDAHMVGESRRAQSGLALR
jgi:hypothetical protein